MGHRSWRYKELDTTDQLTLSLLAMYIGMHFKVNLKLTSYKQAVSSFFPCAIQ